MENIETIERGRDTVALSNLINFAIANVDLKKDAPNMVAQDESKLNLPGLIIDVARAAAKAMDAQAVEQKKEQPVDKNKEQAPPEKLPDNVFDRADAILKRLPMLGIRVTAEQGDLSLRDIGTFLKAVDAPISSEQEKALNAIRGAQVRDGVLRLDWQHSGKLKDLLPDATDVPDGLVVRAAAPSFKVSADENAKWIKLTHIKGITAFNEKLPLLQLPALESVTATKKTDADGKPVCELTFTLPKFPGLPNELRKTLPLDGHREAVFDAAMKQIASGKGCGKLVEMLPALLPGEATNVALPFLSDLKEGHCGDGKIQLKFGQEKQIGNLPLFAGPDVSLESKKLPDGYIFDNIKGVKARLPIPQELLDKFGVSADVPIARLAAGTPDNHGNRLIRIDLEHSGLKSITFAVNKDGAPIINEGRIGMTVQVAVGDKSLDCKVNLPVSGNIKDGMRIYLAGDAEAKVEILKKLGLPGEFAEAGRGVNQIWVKNEHVGIVSDRPARINVQGLNMQLGKEVVFTQHPPVKRNFLNSGMETRSIDLYGVQITDFSFGGSRWKEIGSAALNDVLSAQNDLPITINNLTITTSDKSGRIGIGVRASGALESGFFILESADKPDFVSGSVRVKNPLRGLDPLQVFRNKDYYIDVQLDGSGIKNPIDTGIQLLKPVTDNPVAEMFNPLGLVPAYRVGKVVYENRDGIVEAAKDVANTVGDGAKWVGNKAEKAWNFIFD